MIGKWLYHFSRIVFGGWWLYSGAMPFIDPAWQPLGGTQAAQDFTLALIASGLMTWVKVAEIALGILILANRLMPLCVIAIIPINFVILYWNFVLDEGTIDIVFGTLTILFNAVMAWAWRGYFWPLFAWRGTPDFGTALMPEPPGRA